MIPTIGASADSGHIEAGAAPEPFGSKALPFLEEFAKSAQAEVRARAAEALTAAKRASSP